MLLDLAGVKLGHLKYLTPHLARKTVEVVQEVFPLRFKAFHVLNEPFYFNAVLSMLKPFIKKEKMRRRVSDKYNLTHYQETVTKIMLQQIFTHGSHLESLHKHVPSRLLPEEFGGSCGAFDNTYWRNQILANETYYEQLEQELFLSSDLNNPETVL